MNGLWILTRGRFILSLLRSVDVSSAPFVFAKLSWDSFLPIVLSHWPKQKFESSSDPFSSHIVTKKASKSVQDQHQDTPTSRVVLQCEGSFSARDKSSPLT